MNENEIAPPGYLEGRVVRAEPNRPITFAIAVNGTLRAVTRTYLIDGLRDQWTALVPESAFRHGPNDVRFFVVRNDRGQPTLHPVAPDSVRLLMQATKNVTIDP